MVGLGCGGLFGCLTAPFSLQARPSWAVLWPAGWGPRPHPRGALYPCPLTSRSAPPRPAICPWCSCGPPMPTKVRSLRAGGAEGCWAAVPTLPHGAFSVPSTCGVCPLPLFSTSNDHHSRCGSWVQLCPIMPFSCCPRIFACAARLLAVPYPCPLLSPDPLNGGPAQSAPLS
jgi:hypothetical protein